MFFVDFRTLPRTLSVLPWWIFALAFVLNLVASIVVPAVQTRIALGATGVRLRTSQLVAINLMVRFFILVLPRPAAVGIRWWAYRDAGGEAGGSEAAALMVFERVVQALVITGAMVGLLAVERGRLPGVGDAFWVGASVLFLGAVAGFVAFVWAPVAGWLHGLLAWRGVPSAVRRRAGRLVDALEGFPGLPTKRIVAIVGLSVVYFVLWVASFWVLLAGLEVEIGFGAVAWIRGIVFILTLIPVTLAGIGVREAGFVGFLGLYGVPDDRALAAAVAALAVQLVIGGIGGGVALRRQWRGGDPEREVKVTPSRPAPE